MKAVWIVTDSEGAFCGVFGSAKKAYKYIKAEIKDDYRAGNLDSKVYYLELLAMLKIDYRSYPNDFECHGLSAKQYHVH